MTVNKVRGFLATLARVRGDVHGVGDTGRERLASPHGKQLPDRAAWRVSGRVLGTIRI